jgi:hypothetical protein
LIDVPAVAAICHAGDYATAAPTYYVDAGEEPVIPFLH